MSRRYVVSVMAANRIGVLAITLDEGRALLGQAGRDPTLRSVRWWTGRHLAQSMPLLADEPTARFVSSVGLTAVSPLAITDPAVVPARDELTADLGGPPSDLTLFPRGLMV